MLLRWLKKVSKNRRLCYRVLQILFVCALVAALLHISSLRQEKTELAARKTRMVAELEHHNAQLQAELATFKAAEEYELREMNITKYAPLDDAAVAGWDYAGDPEITASGETVIPGRTAAAGPNIPFGTRIYVEGMGWYTVKDRGGLIGPDDIDLATESKEDSLAWGVQQRLVIIEKPQVFKGVYFD